MDHPEATATATTTDNSFHSGGESSTTTTTPTTTTNESPSLSVADAIRMAQGEDVSSSLQPPAPNESNINPVANANAGNDEQVDLYSWFQEYGQQQEAAPDALAGLQPLLTANPNVAEQFNPYLQELQEKAQRAESWQQTIATAGFGEQPEALFEAVSWLQQGTAPVEIDGQQYAGVDAGLYRLYEANPELQYAVESHALQNIAQSPERFETLRDWVLQQINLNPEMLKDYQNVTLDGGYKAVLEEQALKTLLSDVQDHSRFKPGRDYAKAFRSFPTSLQAQIQMQLEDGDTDAALFQLNNVAQQLELEERDVQQRTQEAQAAEQKAQLNAMSSSNAGFFQAMKSQLDRLTVAGIPPSLAKEIAFDVLMEAGQAFYDKNSPIAKVDYDVQPLLRKGQKIDVASRYQAALEPFFQKALQGRKVARATLPTKKTAPNTPPNNPNGAQFPPNTGLPQVRYASVAEAIADAQRG
jgi:hypothetical protein